MKLHGSVLRSATAVIAPFDSRYSQETRDEVLDDSHNHDTADIDDTERDGGDRMPLLVQTKNDASDMDVIDLTNYQDCVHPTDGAIHPVGESANTPARISVKRSRPLGLIIFASLNFSIMSVLVRVNKVDLHVEPGLRGLLFFRCVIGSICISLGFYAVSQMVLTDATVITFTSPVMTFVMGAWLLNEPIERIDFVCALLSYIGVLFVARPAFLFPSDTATKEASTIAVVCALGAAFTQSCVQIAVRKLHRLNYISMLHYWGIFGIFFSGATLLCLNISFTFPTKWNIILAIFLSAFASTIGMLAVTLGCQQENAGVASVMRYFDVVFVFIFDSTLLGEHVNAYSILGGCIILTGAIVIAVRRARATK